MIKVALTGNIGSGKSTVAQIFNVFGIKVFNADLEARKLYNNKSVIDMLVDVFTDKILSPAGEVDKKKLAEIIFNDKQALKTINGIIHPPVLKKYTNWCLLNKDEHYTVHESAILFENNLQGKFDYVICVSAKTETRIKRVVDRDNISRSSVKERIANQLSNEEKCSLSQFVINNDEGEFLIPQVIAIHRKLLSYYG